MLFGKDAGQGNQYGKEERGGAQSRQRVQGGQHGDGNVHTGEAVAGLGRTFEQIVKTIRTVFCRY